MSKLIDPGYQAFNISHAGIVQRVITDIDISEAYEPDTSPGALPKMIFRTQALWDTGATNSVITTRTATEIGLIPTGRVNVSNAESIVECNTYMVNVILPNRLQIKGLQVSEMRNHTQGFGAIIGMDIIGSGDFALTNYGGKTNLSFRYPSIATIDYVKEHFRTAYAHIGRNEPCPCGALNSSGKPLKYKDCCKRKYNL